MPFLLLLTLGLIGLPIVLHLILRQQPKRVRFPAIRFLQQTQRTTQRKLQLRHWLLMALRMLVIGLFGFALFQPKIPSTWSGLGIDLSGQQPLAVILVIDTTPSMGYLVEQRTRLQDAVSRATELLERLPAGSKIAILTPEDPVAEWLPNLTEARRRLEGAWRPSGVARPLTNAIPATLRLWTELDREEASTGTSAGPRLVAFMTDRAQSSWNGDRSAEWQAAYQKLANPQVAFLLFDVGVDAPVNVALLNLQASPAQAPVGTPISVQATVMALGTNLPATRIELRSSTVTTPLQQDVELQDGVPQIVSFVLRDLPLGEHNFECLLPTPDNLGPAGLPGFDNVRYLTVRVGQGRQMLVITDDPTDAAFWELAHKNLGEFQCVVQTPQEVRELTGFEFVTLLSVKDPARVEKDGRSLWMKLKPYLQSGGRLLIIPGGLEQLNLASYDPQGPADGIMPGRISRIVDWQTAPEPMAGATEPDRSGGVSWDWSDTRVLQHPLLAPFQPWLLSGTVDFLRTPRRAWKYWKVEAPAEAVLLRYDDAAQPEERTPAILERTTANGGRVLLLTTRWDSPWESDRKWNDYYDLEGNAFPVVFPNLLAKYLSGDVSENPLQFTTGQTIRIPWRRPDSEWPAEIRLEGPNLTAEQSRLVLNPEERAIVIPPDRTTEPGHYRLVGPENRWSETISLNIDPVESQLAKADAATIEGFTGPDSILAVGKEADFNRLLDQKSQDQPLAPWLLLILAVILGGEAWLANRFYGKPSRS